MQQQIIKPTSEQYTIAIPKERRSLKGALSHYKNPTLIEKEKDIAWRAAGERFIFSTDSLPRQTA